MRLRLFALCILATHMPLLTYLLRGFSTGRIAPAECILLALATIAGAAIALFGIGALLGPVQALAETPHPREAEAAARTDELHHATHEDRLTGVANRRGFLAQVAMLPIGRRKGCVVLIDIDYFKRINDQLGHDEGDRVLAAFAARLCAQLRRIDIVARWGGEMFALFFQDCIEDEVSWSLARVASQMRSDPIALVNGRPISFSAGLCRWKGDELEDALRRADEALYEAKQAGRDRIYRAKSSLQDM
nr:GGDEF domain-containing protein [Sphingobium sp. BYY-5]